MLKSAQLFIKRVTKAEGLVGIAALFLLLTVCWSESLRCSAQQAGDKTQPEGAAPRQVSNTSPLLNKKEHKTPLFCIILKLLAYKTGSLCMNSAVTETQTWARQKLQHCGKICQVTFNHYAHWSNFNSGRIPDPLSRFSLTCVTNVACVPSAMWKYPRAYLLMCSNTLVWSSFLPQLHRQQQWIVKSTKQIKSKS